MMDGEKEELNLSPDIINVKWTNTETSCIVVMVYLKEDDEKPYTEILTRKCKWQVSPTLFNLTEKELHSLQKEKARKLWYDLINNHNFESTENED